MSERFDPYHKWLGISHEEQPPNHYRLLGVREFESDADAISNAADQRMLLVRSFQTGPNAAEAEVILTEIAAARICLLDPTKKAAYDGPLRLKVARKKPKPANVAADLRDPNDLLDEASESTGFGRFVQGLGTKSKSGSGGSARSGRRKKKPTGLIIALLTATAGILLVGFIYTMTRNGPDKVVEKDDGEITSTENGSDVTNSDPKNDSTSDESVKPRLVLVWPETDRTDATVRIDGHPYKPIEETAGHLAFELTSTQHELKIEREGYTPLVESFTLSDGDTIRLDVRLKGKIQSDGLGLLAEYCNGLFQEQVLVTQIDRKVQFFWNTQSPRASVPVDKFSVRWTGFLKAPKAGRYKLRFRCGSYDTAKIWLDGREVLLAIGRSEEVHQVEMELTGKPQPLKIEYSNQKGIALACFNWVPPGGYIEQTVPSEALFHDEAVATRTEVDESIFRKAYRTGSMINTPGKPIDLLPRIDPDRHAIGGAWWFDGEALVCDVASAALVEVPCSLSEAYTIRMDVERLDRSEAMVLNLTAGGKPFTITLDGWGREGGISGVELIDGVRADRNITRKTGRLFEPGERHSIVYKVAPDQVLVSVDGKAVIDWTPDFSRCSRYLAWIGDRSTPFELGAWESRFRIHRLELTELDVVTKKPDDGTTVAPPPPTDLQFVRLTELTATSPKVGWDYFGVNRSPSGYMPFLSRDSRPCKEYVYVNAPVSLSFAVPTGAKAFTGVGYSFARDAVDYRVLADEKVLFEKEKGHIVPMQLDLPMGCKQLTLQAIPAGDDKSAHAFWLVPRLYAIPVKDIKGFEDPARHASMIQIEPTERQVDNNKERPVLVNTSPYKFDPPLVTSTEPCDEYLYAHASSSATYDIPKGTTEFSAIGHCPRSHVSFQVVVDNVIRYKSPTSGIVPIRVALPSGAKTLELRVDSLGSGYGDGSSWCYPRYYGKMTNGQAIVPKSVDDPDALGIELSGETIESTKPPGDDKDPKLPRNPAVLMSFEPGARKMVSQKLQVLDISGNRQHGFVANAVSVDGKVGKALAFDGKQGFVVVQNHANLQGGSAAKITVALWFRVVNANGYNPLVTKYWTKSDKDWGLIVNEGKLGFIGAVRGRGYTPMTGTVKSDTWHHGAFVLDQAKRSLLVYLDGKLVYGDLQLANVSASTEAHVTLGNASYHSEKKPGETMLGAIDELVIYARCLDEREIRSLHRLGMEGKVLLIRAR